MNNHVSHCKNYNHNNNQFKCIRSKYRLPKNNSWITKIMPSGKKKQKKLNLTIKKEAKFNLMKQVLGIISVGLVAYYFQSYYHSQGTAVIFFYLMAVAFLICSTCLLLACIVSWSTGGLISKTMFVSLVFYILFMSKDRYLFIFVIGINLSCSCHNIITFSIT